MKEQRNPSTVHAPVGPYAHQIELSGTERLLVLSGQVGMAADGTVPASAAEQFEVALENVLHNLEAAGMSAADVVKLTIYLPEPVPPEERGPILTRLLGGATPCMTLLYVAGLAAPQLKVELDAWASASA